MKLRVNFLPKKKLKGTLFAKNKNEVTMFAKKCILKFYEVRCKLFAKKKSVFLNFMSLSEHFLANNKFYEYA